MEQRQCRREENFPISRAPGLHVSHRGSKTLIVEPGSASWAIMPREHYAILESLERPLFLQELMAKNPGMDSAFLNRLIHQFHSHGMAELNWKRFYPPEEIMWRPLDDYPVYPRDFYFHTTDACNFRCTYCYAEAGGHGRTMSLETMKAIMERVFREIPHESVSFVFHGGEPLLLKKTLFAATEWAEMTARRYNKRAFFAMQTNGALIDDDVIAWAKRFKVDIGVTLDGPPEIHDASRIYPDGRGTFRDVWDASQKALREKVWLGYLCIVHRPENYLKSYEFFVSRGIFSFNMRYSFAVGRAAKSYQFTLEKGRDMAFGALEVLDRAVEFYKRTGIALRINDLDTLLRNLTSKKRDYMCMRSPCGIGRSILAFGPDGELYPCEEMSPYPELSCGTIRDRRPLTEIIDSSAMLLKLRERRVECITKCRDCTWRRFCMGRCTHKTIHYFGDAMHEDPSCLFFSTLFEELAWRIDSDRAILALA
jgi:uncharacterized protein